MKKFITTTLLTMNLTASLAYAEIKSVYTDINQDCITVSETTDRSEVDHFESVCKSYDGYVLKMRGMDLRYHPELTFDGKLIDIQPPMSFHQMASDKIEWVYSHTRDEQGFGTINFKALIYRIAYEDENNRNRNILYVVRLNGKNSCVIGKVNTNTEARELANNASASCVLP